jgi:hypothetical protein
MLNINGRRRKYLETRNIRKTYYIRGVATNIYYYTSSIVFAK